MSKVPPASAIADVLALWSLDGWLTPPLLPIVWPGSPVLGTARTVTLAHGSGGAALGALYDVLDGDLSDQVLVLAGADQVPGAVWGEILATAAAQSSVAGVLVHGAVRDIADLPATPLYALSTNVVGPNGLAHVVALDAAVTIDDVDVDHDDRIVADATGCVRIRASESDAVLEAAAAYAAAEEQVVQAVRSGEPLAEAYLIKKTAVDQLRKG